MLTQTQRVGIGVLLAAALTAAGWQWQVARQLTQRDERLRARLDQRFVAEPASGIDCRSTAAAAGAKGPESQSLHILVLGQSNAGNHGQADPQAPMLDSTGPGGQCLRSRGPMPGGTGTGGAIWPYLNQDIEHARPASKPPRWSMLAIDASSIGDWTRRHSPLRRQLIEQLTDLRTQGLTPDLILWQQGEADAQLDTPRQDYLEGLLQLSDLLIEAEVQAPLILGRSTVCRSAPHDGVREAIDEALLRWPERFQPGADTDTLTGADLRLDGCHFSRLGLQQAAKLWFGHVESRLPLVQAPGRPQ